MARVSAERWPDGGPRDGSSSTAVLRPELRGSFPDSAAADGSPAAVPSGRERRHFRRFLYPRLAMTLDGGTFTSLNWSLAGALLSGRFGPLEIGDELRASLCVHPGTGWHDFLAIVMRRAPARDGIVIGFIRQGLGAALLLEEQARHAAAGAALCGNPNRPRSSARAMQAPA